MLFLSLLILTLDSQKRSAILFACGFHLLTIFMKYMYLLYPISQFVMVIIYR